MLQLFLRRSDISSHLTITHISLKSRLLRCFKPSLIKYMILPSLAAGTEFPRSPPTLDLSLLSLLESSKPSLPPFSGIAYSGTTQVQFTSLERILHRDAIHFYSQVIARRVSWVVVEVLNSRSLLFCSNSSLASIVRISQNPTSETRVLHDQGHIYILLWIHLSYIHTYGHIINQLIPLLYWFSSAHKSSSLHVLLSLNLDTLFSLLLTISLVRIRQPVCFMAVAVKWCF